MTSRVAVGVDVVHLNPVGAAADRARVAVAVERFSPRRLPVRVIRSRLAATPEVTPAALVRHGLVGAPASWAAADLVLCGAGLEGRAARWARALFAVLGTPPRPEVARHGAVDASGARRRHVERTAAGDTELVLAEFRPARWYAFATFVPRCRPSGGPAFGRAVAARRRASSEGDAALLARQTKAKAWVDHPRTIPQTWLKRRYWQTAAGNVRRAEAQRGAGDLFDHAGVSVAAG
jgi:hypothetical protein